MGSVLRRFLALVACALVLAGCRLDVDVSVAIEPDGTGIVTVYALADAELANQVPGLVDALVFDDAEAAGWQVDGPRATADGGVEVTLVHTVTGPQELTNVLDSLGPPFTDMRAGRTTDGDQTSNAIDGTLQLPDGFESFADADLIAAAGGLPFEQQFDEMGTTPAESMSFTLRIQLPGEVISTTGVEVEPNVLEWQAPLDGSSLSIATVTVQRPADGGAWAGPLATAALVALIVWVALSVAFISFVVVTRRRRQRRRPPRTSRSPAIRDRAR
jgi:hypothetical protein